MKHLFTIVQTCVIKMSIEGEYNPPLCISCGKPIVTFENAAHFYCPNCGEVLIWRCEKCRVFARKYKCPKCGFTGP